MSNPQTPWFQMNNEKRREEIIKRRHNNESFAQIAEALLGSSKKKSTIWSWAKRNLSNIEIYPRMAQFSSEPYGDFSDVQQWIMFDIMSSLFPRLDAMSEHLLIEISKIHTEQKEKFRTTAGFLDDLEDRIMGAIGRVSRSISPMAVSSSVPPPVPGRRSPGSPPPPPPPGTILLAQEGVPPDSIGKLRTDFEEMTMEEITALPQDFLEALTPSDRNRLQERVKELKKIEKMTPEEREAYLTKKLEEKEREEAAEGLGGSLTAMLDDSDSLFARMRKAADDSQVSGTGTFGKFTTEYIYFYCFACGKMNRSEDKDTITSCFHCSAGVDQLVQDAKKSDYTYWECLSAKNREPVDLNYTRGKQIVVRSRWKVPAGEKLNSDVCPPNEARDITSAVLVKTDPDKQFSHYITLLRMYTQLNLQGDLKTHLQDLSDEIQKIPDILSREAAVHQASIVLDKVKFLLDWLGSRNIVQAVPDSEEVQIQINNLNQDLKLLRDPESPQELKKTSEVGQISSKIDQILNRFTSMFLRLESELLTPSRWKCSECNNIFEVKDRFNIPEFCGACGKIITKLEPVD
jgi:rubrerythrin